MVFVLLVSADSKRGVRMREALTAQGWWATLVTDREGALRAAADHEPEVVIVDENVMGATELVKIFTSRNGGPGAIALSAPEGQLESLAMAEAGADEVLSDNPSVDGLVGAVQRVAAIPHYSTGPAPSLGGQQLTADEIFGDILEEVESGAGDEPPEPMPTVREVPVASLEPGAGESGWDADQPAEESSEVEITAPGLEETPVDFIGLELDLPEPPFPITEEERGAPAAREVSPAEPSKPAMADATERRFGQYRLEERIAVGGMAEVWRASMEGLEGFQKTVAIKKILPHLAENDEFVAMFVDEAKLAAQLNHENLVDIYDLGKIDEDFFIAMEYVDGRDLRSILNRLKRRDEKFPLGLACFIAARIAAALDYAHARCETDGTSLGLVHRDVSPRNILISHDGNIRLCDFGVAKAVSSVAQTEIGALKGKIQYMSPEQAQGERVDGRSDIFSLGNVLFEMTTGRRLFVEDSEVSLLEAVRSGVIDEPRSVRPDVPEEINGIILHALSKVPETRYSRAGEMQAALEEVTFRLDPKPTQGVLADWMRRVFEGPVAPPGPIPGDLGSPAGEAEAEEQKREHPVAGEDRTDEGPIGSRPEVGTAEIEETAADRDEASTPGARSRKRFWFGVAAGLLLAVLAAIALDAWLVRRARPRPATSTSSVSTVTESEAGSSRHGVDEPVEPDEAE